MDTAQVRSHSVYDERGEPIEMGFVWVDDLPYVEISNELLESLSKGDVFDIKFPFVGDEIHFGPYQLVRKSINLNGYSCIFELINKIERNKCYHATSRNWLDWHVDENCKELVK